MKFISSETIKTVMAIAVSIILFSCASHQSIRNSHYSDAQKIVDKVASQHSQLVRLTIHAVPTGKDSSEIIACNIQEKIGQASDPEDLEAMKTNKTVTLVEGENLDVTAPICDASGKPIAATGITLRFQKGETEADVIAKAQAISEELTREVQNAEGKLW